MCVCMQVHNQIYIESERECVSSQAQTKTKEHGNIPAKK